MRIPLVVAGVLLASGAAGAQPVGHQPIMPTGPLQTPLRMPGDQPDRWIPPPPGGGAYSLQMEGRVAQLGADQLRISREDAPDALLSVAPETSFFLDGAPVTFDQVPEGAKVLATFDIRGQERIAMRVDVATAAEPIPEEQVAPPVSPEIPGMPPLPPLPNQSPERPNPRPVPRNTVTPPGAGY